MNSRQHRITPNFRCHWQAYTTEFTALERCNSAFDALRGSISRPRWLMLHTAMYFQPSKHSRLQRLHGRHAAVQGASTHQSSSTLLHSITCMAFLIRTLAKRKNNTWKNGAPAAVLGIREAQRSGIGVATQSTRLTARPGLSSHRHQPCSLTCLSSDWGCAYLRARLPGGSGPAAAPAQSSARTLRGQSLRAIILNSATQPLGSSTRNARWLCSQSRAGLLSRATRARVAACVIRCSQRLSGLWRPGHSPWVNARSPSQGRPRGAGCAATQLLSAATPPAAQ